MKKIISLIAVLFTAIVLTGCFGELNSLEWSELPKSVYYKVGQSDHASAVESFMTAAKVKIDGKEVTLKQAVENHGATVDGFDLTSTGSKVITVKYASLTIYWAYQVIEEDIPSDEVTPEYDWYDGKSSPYTLSSIEDLYGFANIVNGKRLGHQADSFAGETVKLAADIDLTGKVWEPIGAAPRKVNIPLTYVDTPSDPAVANELYFSGTKLYYTDNNKKQQEAKNLITLTSYDKTGLLAYLDANLVSGSKEFCYIGSHVVAQEDDEGNFSDTGTGSYTLYHAIDEVEGNFFEGIFDGQGHKVTGLSDVGYTPTVVYNYANVNRLVVGYTFGLFGVVTGDVTVKNVTFENVEVVGAYYDINDSELVLAEIDSVGAAIGYIYGEGDLTLDNVKVLSGSIFGYDAVAGIVGRAYNSGFVLIQNCENRANIVSKGHTGGIGGYFGDQEEFVKFLNCTNYGNISSTKEISDTKCAGGLINRTKQPEITTYENCRNFGNITGVYAILVEGKRGIDAGYSTLPTYTNCSNYGVLQIAPLD